MPFGAEFVEENRVRFRLWAPSARDVSLVIAPGPAQDMIQLPRGWWELVTEAARSDRYLYRIDGDVQVPDPASRRQPGDVHGASEIVDPAAFPWPDDGWRGRPWEEAVIYELHVGTFSDSGTFPGVAEKLDHLARLGVTAIELMPIADFPGRRNWGYDGVLPFAPDATYGTPEELKSLIVAAHERGLMMLLDVVYNHFGPEGNYLHRYASSFFTERHRTPWGAAIAFDDGPTEVRDFFVHNALYWLEEYRFDGLRLDAVHAITDESPHHILAELAERVRAALPTGRRVHLVLENDANEAHWLEREPGDSRRYDAQWNDDLHHALHVAATGEQDGYYADYADAPASHAVRALTEGFAWQGEGSPHRGGRPRGEPSVELPLSAFVSFAQNHDQIGNRALGERLTVLAADAAQQAIAAVLLLAPGVPLLFMGEEFAADTPFLFFCDLEPGLAEAVTRGRREEFAAFARFGDPEARQRIPDPAAETTFLSSRLDWRCLERPHHAARLEWYRNLLALRARAIVPRIRLVTGMETSATILSLRAFRAEWQLDDGATLALAANLSDTEAALTTPLGSEYLYLQPGGIEGMLAAGRLPAWSVAWCLDVRHDD